MNSDSAFRVALIGYGLAGSVFHAPLIHATPGLRLTNVFTTDAQRAAQARARFDSVQTIDDLEALWAQRPDLVVIASPNRSHYPLALQALRAGSAVVVDKPLAVSAAEAQHLVDEARQRGVLLSVFHNRRWDGDFLTLHKLLDTQRLGQVHRFESRFERWRPAPRPGWRQAGDPRDGGGVLLDLGSHLIDQAVQLFGPVQSLYAELDRRHPETLVEDDAFVALHHASGIRSHLWMSSMAADDGPRLRVLGSDGAYVKQGLDGQENALRNGMLADDPSFGHEPESAWGQLLRGEERRAIESVPGQWTSYYAGIEQALRNGTPPPVNAKDAVHTLHLIEAARRSATLARVICTDPATGSALD